MKIRFNYRNVKFRIRESGKHKIWISDIISGEGWLIDNIQFVFTRDEDVRDINSEFLQHDYYTDVIAFDYSEGRKVAGEIYISVERVRENSKKFGVSLAEELRRVMAHAVLHLCGYDDDARENKEKMTKREDFWLNKWANGSCL